MAHRFQINFNPLGICVNCGKNRDHPLRHSLLDQRDPSGRLQHCPCPPQVCTTCHQLWHKTQYCQRRVYDYPPITSISEQRARTWARNIQFAVDLQSHLGLEGKSTRQGFPDVAALIMYDLRLPVPILQWISRGSVGFWTGEQRQVMRERIASYPLDWMGRSMYPTARPPGPISLSQAMMGNQQQSIQGSSISVAAPGATSLAPFIEPIDLDIRCLCGIRFDANYDVGTHMAACPAVIRDAWRSLGLPAPRLTDPQVSIKQESGILRSNSPAQLKRYLEDSGESPIRQQKKARTQGLPLNIDEILQNSIGEILKWIDGVQN